MADDYTDTLTAEVEAAAPLDLTMPEVRHAELAFDAIPERGTRFTCSVDGPFFAGHRADRYREVTNPGRNRTDNHLQGVQRYRDRLYLSAGDLMERCAHLFIARYVPPAPGAPPGARLVRVLSLDDHRDHSGGMQRSGDVLAIAIEGHRTHSIVGFLHLADPDHPTWIAGARIDRDVDKASAAALTTLPTSSGARALAGVTWVRRGWFFGKFGTRAFLDLYLSRETSLHAGFLPEWTRVDITRLVSALPAWQAIAFLPTTSSAEVMLVGTRSSGSAPGGTATADLCRLRFDDDPANVWPPNHVVVEHVRSRTFRFADGYGDFAAAAGIDIDASGAVSLLAAGHFRFSDGFRLSLNAPAADGTDPITPLP